MMMGSSVRVALTAAVLAAFVATPASAAVNFAFEASVSDVQLNVGGQALVDIFLTETVSDGDASILAAEKGLQSAAVVVASELPVAGTSTIASYTLNPAFNDLDLNYVGEDPMVAPYTSLDVSLGIDFDNNPTTGVVGTVSGNVTRVRILSVVVNAASAAGVTTFSLSDNPNLEESFTFGVDGTDGRRLLDLITSAGSFTVTTNVPEPTSIAAIAAAGVAIARRRRSRP